MCGVHMKIALIGTSNCGKTTLVKELEKQGVFKNHTIINEVAANFSKESRKSLVTQVEILQALIDAEQRYPNFVSDRSAIDNYAYFMWYYKNAPCKSSHSELYLKYINKFNFHMIQKPYDQLIFIDEYFDLEDNGIREMDEDMQLWIFENIKYATLLFKNIYDIPVSFINGSTNDRIALIKEICEPHYKQKRMQDYV